MDFLPICQHLVTLPIRLRGGKRVTRCQALGCGAEFALIGDHPSDYSWSRGGRKPR